MRLTVVPPSACHTRHLKSRVRTKDECWQEYEERRFGFFVLYFIIHFCPGPETYGVPLSDIINILLRWQSIWFMSDRPRVYIVSVSLVVLISPPFIFYYIVIMFNIVGKRIILHDFFYLNISLIILNIISMPKVCCTHILEII